MYLLLFFQSCVPCDVLRFRLARHTGHKIEKIAEDTQRDYYLTSQEAMDYGLIDEVMQNRKLKAV